MYFGIEFDLLKTVNQKIEDFFSLIIAFNAQENIFKTSL